MYIRIPTFYPNSEPIGVPVIPLEKKGVSNGVGHPVYGMQTTLQSIRKRMLTRQANRKDSTGFGSDQLKNRSKTSVSSIYFFDLLV